MATTTINDWIKESRQEDIKMSNYFYQGVLTDDVSRIHVLEDSILIPYDNRLNKYKKTHTMTKEELRTYAYNPWRLAKDLYGSTEYWFLVLHANEMYSANEFCSQTVTLYTTDVLNEIEEIRALNDKNIKSNISEVSKHIKGLPAKLDRL